MASNDIYKLEDGCKHAMDMAARAKSFCEDAMWRVSNLYDDAVERGEVTPGTHTELEDWMFEAWRTLSIMRASANEVYGNLRWCIEVYENENGERSLLVHDELCAIAPASWGETNDDRKTFAMNYNRGEHFMDEN